MMPAANKGGGGDIAFPDVCKTPAGPALVPIPYPCLGLNAMAAPFSPNVFWSMVPALNQLSMIPLTSGMEAGAAGGVVGGVIKGPALVARGNPIVFVNMAPAKNLLCQVTGNLGNAMLGWSLIPSITNVLLTCAGEAAEARNLSPEAARAMGAELEASEDLELRLEADGVARLRLPVFDQDVSRRVFNALAPAYDGVERLVLDLRGNRGGDARAALELAGDFVARGTALCVQIDADGDETPLVARHGEPYPWPLDILVDGGTASAAELFAGALQAAGRARLVGERTCGKLTAQRLSGGEEPGSRYPTVASFRLPGGKGTGGLIPDVKSG